VAARVLKTNEANLEIVPGAVRVSHMAGMMHQVTGTPRRVRLKDLLHLSFGYPGFCGEAAEAGLAEIDYFFPPHATYANGTHVAEVEVDPELGRVDILRYTVGHDCGRTINPLIVEMESPSPLNPIGVKGAGDGGTIPAAAAIIAAVEDALAPFGIKINEAPISAERIVALVGRSQTKPSSFSRAKSLEHGVEPVA
jgi:aerobic carbon-monoxide dehydrogenase large subunit